MNRRKLAYLFSLVLIGAAAWDPAIPRYVPSAEYLFVFDISLSMSTPDEQGKSRLDAAKAMVRRALDKLPAGSRVSIGAFVGMDFQVLLRSRSVRDREVIEQALDLVRWENAWTTGSLLGWAMDKLVRKATREWELSGPLNVFFFTDGGSGGVPAHAGFLWERASGDALRITFVGVGDPIPSPVPALAPGEECLRPLDRQECFESALNEPMLQELASSVRGYYVRARQYAGKEDQLFRERLLLGEPTRVLYPVGPILAGVALVLFLGGVIW